MAKIQTVNEYWDAVEKEQRSLAREALALFEKIVDGLDTTSFSFRDVKESFFWLTGSPPILGDTTVCPRHVHLDLLVREGLLVSDGPGQYHVNENAYFLDDIPGLLREDEDDTLEME
jgi:hypothetical protein